MATSVGRNDKASDRNHDDSSSDRGNYGSVLSNESESSAQATFENQNLQTTERTRRPANVAAAKDGKRTTEQLIPQKPVASKSPR
jgi:hypothetical protein